MIIRQSILQMLLMSYLICGIISGKDGMEEYQAFAAHMGDGGRTELGVIRELYLYTEQRNDISIYYPQLTGFEDAAKEERINALIEADVKKLIGKKNKEGDDTLYCLNLDCEIQFLNDRIVSILYEGGHGYITPGHGYPAKAAATTIDIEEEKVIAVKDVVTDFSELTDMLLTDEFESITMWDGQRMEEYEADFVAEKIRLYGLDEELQWYTDGDHFIIILEGYFHDYDEYSISNESARHILDEEFLKKLE